MLQQSTSPLASSTMVDPLAFKDAVSDDDDEGNMLRGDGKDVLESSGDFSYYHPHKANKPKCNPALWTDEEVAL
jgi:hypothetical protein